MRISRLAFVFALLLTSCTTSEPPPQPLDYAQLGKINLDVKDLTFVDRGIDRAPSAKVITILQPSIADALHNWVAQRLQATGNDGIAAFVVKNAYVTEEDLSPESTWFERQQSTKLNGHVEVEFDARGKQGYALATANAARSVTVPEHASDGEKQDAYNRLLSGMMQDLDKYLEQAIREHMHDFIVTDPVIGSHLPPPDSLNQVP